MNVKRILRIENSFSSDRVTVPANWSKCASNKGNGQLHQHYLISLAFPHLKNSTVRTESSVI